MSQLQLGRNRESATTRSIYTQAVARLVIYNQPSGHSQHWIIAQHRLQLPLLEYSIIVLVDTIEAKRQLFLAVLLQLQTHPIIEQSL